MAEKTASKKTKFFCEHCGKEVNRNAKNCPDCGRFFASVRCPCCNYIGSPSEFSEGCPSCGYAVSPDASKNTKNNIRLITKKAASSAHNKRDKYDDPLPWWVYSIVLGIAVVLIAIIISRQ